jgi:hypothetical protein
VMPGLAELGGRELGLHHLLDLVPLIAGIDDLRGKCVEAFERPAVGTVPPITGMGKFSASAPIQLSPAALARKAGSARALGAGRAGTVNMGLGPPFGFTRPVSLSALPPLHMSTCPQVDL